MIIDEQNNSELNDENKPINQQEDTCLDDLTVPEIEEEAEGTETLFINEFTDGILNLENDMLGPLRDGGTIIANVAPGGWGPMITPEIRSGHEVTKPVFVEGAEVGDAIVIKIKSIQITSMATASGTGQPIEDRFIRDPLINVKCPGCGKLHPNTVVEGIGRRIIRCSTCETETAPFDLINGYTMAFDAHERIGITVGKEGARKIASNPNQFMRIPEKSNQHPIVAYAPTDLIGVMARVRPFLGQLGTLPPIAMPSTHNAGDLGRYLVDESHEFSITKEQLDEHRTDGHLDINRVREGAVLICPVKVRGAGVYLGDLNAMQGDGKIAGHTTDVAGIVQLQIKVLKKIKMDGPILLQNVEDLAYTAKPFTKDEKRIARNIAAEYGVKQLEEAFPVSFVGTGHNINLATENALERAAKLLELPLDEVKNRATIAGSIEIGRLPGVVTATLQVPKTILKNCGIYKPVKQQYDC